ncbi:MAG: metal-dependent hydrolase [Pseudomonadota bacterium]
MDILTHVVAGALGGAAVGLGLRGGRARVLSALVFGAVGGALPDLDAITRYPGFDGGLGHLLHLAPGREIYAGALWYSHHHFTHSLVAAGGATALSAGLLGLDRVGRGPGMEGERDAAIWALPLCLLAGFLLHLVGDLPTPASVWGGIQLFWPSARMVGGWGWTWWFHNYDVFLVQCAGLGGVLLASLVPRHRPILARLLPMSVLALALAASTALLASREHDYAYRGHAPDYQALEDASLEQQRRSLPASWYAAMRALSEYLPVPF